jgi:hypothetical protein
MRRLKRYVLLGVLGGVAFAVWRARSRRNAAPEVGPPASWPPLEVGEPPVAAVGDLVTDEPDVPGPWVEPVDGACPVTHPVKVGAGSKVFHVPGGRFYERTRPQRCYVDAAAAEADGYRAAKEVTR